MNRVGYGLSMVFATGVVLMLVSSRNWSNEGIAQTVKSAEKTKEEVAMKFGYMLLFVGDVEKSLEFYESAFGLRRKFYNLEGDQGYGELETGATTLGFVSYALAKSNGVTFSEPQTSGPAPAASIGLVTKDVAGAYENAIKAGAAAVAKPEPKPWGETVAYVRDINGFLVSISSGVEK